MYSQSNIFRFSDIGSSEMLKAGPRDHACFLPRRYLITGLPFMINLLSLITAFSLEVHESYIFDCAVSDSLTLQHYCEEKYIKYWEK